MSVFSRGIVLAMTLLCVIVSTSAITPRMARYARLGGAAAAAGAGGAVAAAGGSCPTSSNYLNPSTNSLTTLSSLGVTKCYFIAANGSDSNNGTSETTPWAHAPGMPNCASNCAAVTPSAGTGFIFRGGDTLAATYFNVVGGGSAGSPVYYGVDQSWYSGSSWNRPLIALNGTLPNVNSYGESMIFNFEAGWVTVDNFEITGGTCSPSVSQNYFWNGTGGVFDGIVVTNGYFHGFQAPAGSANVCGSGKLADGNNPAVWILSQITTDASKCHGAFEYNVVDGTDGTGNKGYMTIPADGPGSCATVAYNVMHDICSGITSPLAHDNVVGNFGGEVGQYECASVYGIHNHAIRSNGDATIYNNTIYSTEGEVISVNPNSGSPGSLVYNNVLWHNNASAIDICDNGQGQCNAGVVSVFNNTIEQQTGGSNVYGNCVNLENNVSSLLLQNEFHIFDLSANLACVGAANPPFNISSKGTASTLTYSSSNNLYMSLSQANAAGYTNSEAYVYSPIASSSPTVGVGITGISQAEGNDTSYACSQATINGVVQVSCPVRTSVPRAASGSCTVGVPGCADAGAYQFGSGTSQPSAPTGMAAVVQ